MLRQSRHQCTAKNRNGERVRQTFFTKPQQSHMLFGIVALAHNILKEAGIHQLLLEKKRNKKLASGETQLMFLHLLFFLDILDSTFSLFYKPNFCPSLQSLTLITA
ncbi:hypothetical protein PJ311_01065 [Bacillus sp. CLL-7-23]|uniref:Transposase DDE domain-containing protein n=1 Tax=Bacillus changyiensis TaxID=3004103 RepID=A0ABT4WYR0_9BACI|nr:hypothetical protein [Bacillus changyiensis]MDA7025194.1 hypothetical protein [Bacillus changyiensis]